ncbi:MAG: acyltransferase family protein [Rhodomicrobium sp.]
MPAYIKPVYRPDIDGLRAIAVLAVVFYHAGLPGFSGGFVGVDVFFVISGFLITQIVWSELEAERFSLVGFYIRRVKRIFPALFAVLVLSSIAAFILLVPRDLIAFGESLNATVLFFSNFYWIKHADYFAGPSIDNPLLHTWSLSVEEQFYAVWPLTLLLFRRLLPAKALPYLILALTLVSVVLAEARLPDYPKDAFYFPWCRMGELFLGALLAVSPVSLQGNRLPKILGIAGLAAIGTAIFLYDTSTGFPGVNALLPCAGAALIIAAGTLPNPVATLLSFEPIRRIGLISYSLYLIHWPLFSFTHLYLNRPLPLGPALVLVLVSILLAYASWRYIETPMRKGQFSRPKVFGSAAAAMSALYLTGALFFWTNGFPSRTTEQVLAAQPLEAVPLDKKYCKRLLATGLKSGKACVLGEDRGNAYDFIMWGDSHAHHYLPAIATLAANRKLSGVLFTLNGCHPFLDDTHNTKACRNLNEAVRRWLTENRVKVAILGGNWKNHLKDFRGFLRDGSPDRNRGGFAKTLAFLTSKGIQVSVLDQTPEFSQGVQLCYARALFYGRDGENCVTEPASRLLTWHKELDAYFEFLRKEYSFSVASGAQAICDAQTCRARRGNTLLMSDNSHLTEAGSLAVMPYLKVPLLSDPLDAAPGSERPLASSAGPSPAAGTPPL